MPNGDVYVNMRKLGVITDAIVPLEEIFTVIIAKDKKRFNLHKKLDEDGDHEQVLIISYGVAGTFRGKPGFSDGRGDIFDESKINGGLWFK